ncbi:MAG: hypothetical protein ACREMP_00875 [Candidatus Tyrphobacter sp.]
MARMKATCGARARSPFLIALLALTLASSAAGCAVAGPPYETDDPVPTTYRHYEIYYHIDYHRVASDIEGGVGTLEINYGLFPNTQFSIALPGRFASAMGSTNYGFGDFEVGLKYRFIQESAGSPQVSFYPSITLATGNAQAALGEGHGTLFLPFWAQKSFGKWTVFGGGGLLFDRSATHRSPALQDGIAITRDLSAATNVGIEIFHSASVAGRPSYTDVGVGYIGDIGAYHEILFSAGRALGSKPSAHGYLAYGWRLGPGREEP